MDSFNLDASQIQSGNLDNKISIKEDSVIELKPDSITSSTIIYNNNNDDDVTICDLDKTKDNCQVNKPK